MEDYTDYALMEQELTSRLKEVRYHIKTKASLLANVSHELKTPPVSYTHLDSEKNSEEQSMITSKQRSFLKKLAHELEPTVFLGKSGLTENIKKEMENGFESRELVKVKLQEGCSLSPKEVANELAEELGAEFVQAIGRKFVLYRQSKDNKQIILPKK